MCSRTRQIHVGAVPVGGGAAVSIQTMAKAAPSDLDRIVAQLTAARRAGCDIARVAVPDMAAAGSIGELKARCGLPIVADVHFDYRLAVAAAEAGADGLRVNPGNLGGERKLEAVVEAAAEAGIPIRVGVNAGSMPKEGGERLEATAENMVASALAMAQRIERLGHDAIKVSLKAFDLQTMVAACRRFAERSDIPLHLGLTEAGLPLSGAVRSAAALSLLLADGIGDTLRISLCAPPEVEVRVARTLLAALGLRPAAAVVACPTCGRTRAEIAQVAGRVEQRLAASGLELVVAVMGCEVNGPGEARAAELGIAYGSGGQGLVFERGQVVDKLPNEELEAALAARIEARAEEVERSHD